MGQILGARSFDRLLTGAIFSEICEGARYMRTEKLVGEIEPPSAHHAAVAELVTGLPVEFVERFCHTSCEVGAMIATKRKMRPRNWAHFANRLYLRPLAT
jgi:hypothetical protein